MSENKLKCVDPNCDLHVYGEQDGLCYGRMMVPAESSPATKFPSCANPQCKHLAQDHTIDGNCTIENCLCVEYKIKNVSATEVHSDGIGGACPGCEDCHPATEAEGMEQRIREIFSQPKKTPMSIYAVATLAARAEVVRALEGIPQQSCVVIWQGYPKGSTCLDIAEFAKRGEYRMMPEYAERRIALDGACYACKVTDAIRKRIAEVQNGKK